MKTFVHNGKHKIEYSIVNVSELEGELRIDAEYCNPVYLRNERLITTKKWDFLEHLSKKIENFGAYSLCNLINYRKDGVPYLFVGNIKENEIDINNLKYIDEKTHNILYKSKIIEGDIVFTIAGTIGNAAVVPKQLNNSNSNQAIAKIRNTSLSPFYISTFLNSKYGKNQSQRFVISNVQPNLLLIQVKQLKIPIPSEVFQKQIEKLVLSAYNEREKAEKLYKEAEEILLNELGLKNWKPKTKKIKIGGKEFEEEENISIRNLSECLKVNRSDAEYWEPKYDRFLASLDSLKKNKNIELKNLSMLVDYKKGVEVGSEQYSEEGQIPFIRVSNLNEKGINLNSAKYISEKLYNKLKEQYEPNEGEILFTKDATIGISYLLEKPIKAITSSGILRLIVKNEKVNKEYLNLVLNSSVCKLQINKTLSGAIIRHFKPTEVMNLLIPLINQQTRSKISYKIQQSFKARIKSKELLEIAKRGVDIFIEKDEKEGLKYISEELK